MIIIFDLLVLEVLYEDAYDIYIYISNNKQTSLCKSASLVQVLFQCAEMTQRWVWADLWPCSQRSHWTHCKADQEVRKKSMSHKQRQPRRRIRLLVLLVCGINQFWKVWLKKSDTSKNTSRSQHVTTSHPARSETMGPKWKEFPVKSLELKEPALLPLLPSPSLTSWPAHHPPHY